MTFAGEGHTVYNGSACVSALVTDYLATLALPARGAIYADEAPWRRSAASMRISGPPRTSRWTRPRRDPHAPLSSLRAAPPAGPRPSTVAPSARPPGRSPAARPPPHLLRQAGSRSSRHRLRRMVRRASWKRRYTVTSSSRSVTR
ncbi:alpha/beta hydrolase [Streptomyces sp. B21-108]|uniref:alpha/beta hydrolase n=1 Tax=Streptomyces sp. B21-108 TaxID=3039419 RepID=UPI002FEE9628